MLPAPVKFYSLNKMHFFFWKALIHFCKKSVEEEPHEREREQVHEQKQELKQGLTKSMNYCMNYSMN